jgi:putative oxidoreductase
MGVLVLVGFRRVSPTWRSLSSSSSPRRSHTNFGDGNQLNHFTKNLAIAGGALALFVAGAGAYSVDARK